MACEKCNERSKILKTKNPLNVPYFEVLSRAIGKFANMSKISEETPLDDLPAEPDYDAESTGCSECGD
jgi:hypothetical protein